MRIVEDKRGFTLIELLVTLVILGLVIGLALNTLNFNINKAGEKTEEVFVDTLRDAIDMYVTTQLSSMGGTNSLKVSSDACSNSLNKTHGVVNVYEIKKNDGSDITFNDIIGSSNNNVLTDKEFVNPANEGKDRFNCEKDAVIKLYRDDDFVYYYYVEKSGLECLNNTSGEYSNVITNLPKLATGGYYTCF